MKIGFGKTAYLLTGTLVVALACFAALSILTMAHENGSDCSSCPTTIAENSNCFSSIPQNTDCLTYHLGLMRDLSSGTAVYFAFLALLVVLALTCSTTFLVLKDIEAGRNHFKAWHKLLIDNIIGEFYTQLKNWLKILEKRDPVQSCLRARPVFVF